jgi:hypothetical protein
MATLPQLKTGAVLQYPASKEVAFSTGIVRFLDGAEQRYREYKAPLRRWIIRLNLLDEAELSALEEFFASREGQAGSFSFIDPWSAAAYADCSLDSDSMESGALDQMRCRTTLVVRENRS